MSALQPTEKTLLFAKDPRAHKKKKTRSDWHSLRTFFGTWTLLFVTGAVVKVVEVIIIIFSSVCVSSKRVLLEWRKKEDKKIQKKYTIIFPRLFPSFSLSKVQRFSLSQNAEAPFRVFIFYLCYPKLDKRQKGPFF